MKKRSPPGSDTGSDNDGYSTEDTDTEESEDEEDQFDTDSYEPPRPALDQNALRVAPKSVQERVNSLTSHIEEKGGDRITWTPDGTVTVDGEKIKGSNITDILIDLASDRQKKVPQKGTPGPSKGLDKVGRVLKDSNVSKTLIKNQRRTAQVYGSPNREGNKSFVSKASLTLSPSPIKEEKKSFVSSFLGWRE